MDFDKILPEKGPPINEVSKYIEKYKNDLIVIKYGGNVFIVVLFIINTCWAIVKILFTVQ